MVPSIHKSIISKEEFERAKLELEVFYRHEWLSDEDRKHKARCFLRFII